MSHEHLIAVGGCGWSDIVPSQRNYRPWEHFLVSLRHTEHKPGECELDVMDATRSGTAGPSVSGERQGGTTHTTGDQRRDLPEQNALCEKVIRQYEARVAMGCGEEEERDLLVRVFRPIMVAGQWTPSDHESWALLQAIAHRLQNLVMLKRYAHFDTMCEDMRTRRPADADLMACVRMLQVMKMSEMKDQDEDFDEIGNAIMDIMVSKNTSAHPDEDSGCASVITASKHSRRLLFELLVTKCGAAFHCNHWDTLQIALTGLFQLISHTETEDCAWYAGISHWYQAKVDRYLYQRCSDKARANRLYRQRLAELELALGYFRQDSSADAANMYYSTHLELAGQRIHTGELERAAQHLAALDDLVTRVMVDSVGKEWRHGDQHLCWHAIMKAKLYYARLSDAKGAITILLQTRTLLEDRFSEKADWRTTLGFEIAKYQEKFKPMMEVVEPSCVTSSSEFSDTMVETDSDLVSKTYSKGTSTDTGVPLTLRANSDSGASGSSVEAESSSTLDYESRSEDSDSKSEISDSGAAY